MPGLGRFFAVNVLADGPRQPNGVRTSRRAVRMIRTIYGAPSHIRPLDHLRQFIRIVRKARRDVRTPSG